MSSDTLAYVGINLGRKNDYGRHQRWTAICVMVRDAKIPTAAKGGVDLTLCSQKGASMFGHVSAIRKVIDMVEQTPMKVKFLKIRELN